MITPPLPSLATCCAVAIVKHPQAVVDALAKNPKDSEGESDPTLTEKVCQCWEQFTAWIAAWSPFCHNSHSPSTIDLPIHVILKGPPNCSFCPRID